MLQSRDCQLEDCSMDTDSEKYFSRLNQALKHYCSKVHKHMKNWPWFSDFDLCPFKEVTRLLQQILCCVLSNSMHLYTSFIWGLFCPLKIINFLLYFILWSCWWDDTLFIPVGNYIILYKMYNLIFIWLIALKLIVNSICICMRVCLE